MFFDFLSSVERSQVIRNSTAISSEPRHGNLRASSELLLNLPQLPGRDAAKALMKQLQAGEGWLPSPGPECFLLPLESCQRGTEEWQGWCLLSRKCGGVKYTQVKVKTVKWSRMRYESGYDKKKMIFIKPADNKQQTMLHGNPWDRAAWLKSRSRLFGQYWDRDYWPWLRSDFGNIMHLLNFQKCLQIYQ